MNKEERKAIEYYQDKEISFGVNFDTEKLLKTLGITEEDSFEKHQIRFKTLLNLIEKLQKENEELKADNYELNNRITDLLENISIQKVKDKIEHYHFHSFYFLPSSSSCKAFIIACKPSFISSYFSI